MTPKLYRKRADRLKIETFKLAGFAAVNLPDSLPSDPRFVRFGGSAQDSPGLEAIARQIDEVLCAFDELEECQGSPPAADGSRFGESLRARMTIPVGEAGGRGRSTARTSPTGGGIRPAGDGLYFGGMGDGRPPVATAPRHTTEDPMPEAPNARLIATAREAARHVAEEYPRWVGDDEAARVAGILTRLANRLEAAGRDRWATTPCES